MIRSFESLNETSYPVVCERSINDLDDDCMKVVFQSLSIRDILAMEQVSRLYRSRDYIKVTWTQRCSEKKITAAWSNLFGKQNDPYPEKFAYRTEIALKYFLYDRKKLLKTISWKDLDKDLDWKDIEAKTKIIENCFKDVESWNPDLANYILMNLDLIRTNCLIWIEKDRLKLSHVNHVESAHDGDIDPLESAHDGDIDPYLESGQFLSLNSSFFINNSVFQVKSVGELLLHGLLHLAKYELQHERDFKDIYTTRPHLHLILAHSALKLAMERGVADASLLVTKVMPIGITYDFEKVLMDLAIFSANQKHYRLLEKCLFYYLDAKTLEDVQIFLDERCKIYGKNYPPILIAYAFIYIYKIFDENNEKTPLKVEKAEAYFNKGMERYQQEESPIPAFAYLVGAKIKSKLKKWSEADEYMNHTRMSFDKNILYEAYKVRAKIKENLGDIKEAIYSLNMCLSSIGKNVFGDVVLEGIKAELNRLSTKQSYDLFAV